MAGANNSSPGARGMIPASATAASRGCCAVINRYDGAFVLGRRAGSAHTGWRGAPNNTRRWLVGYGSRGHRSGRLRRVAPGGEFMEEREVRPTVDGGPADCRLLEMPELPEVETIVQDIRPDLVGRTIRRASLSHV